MHSSVSDGGASPSSPATLGSRGRAARAGRSGAPGVARSGDPAAARQVHRRPAPVAFAARARTAGPDPRLPLRHGRRAHPDRRPCTWPPGSAPSTSSCRPRTRDEREFTQDDYNHFVDGKPRLDGVRDFLASRGITLPEGAPDDPADAATVNGPRHPQERAAAARARRARRRGLPGLRALPGGRAGGRAARPPSSPPRPTASRWSPRPASPTCSTRASTALVAAREPARQARARHLPGRRPRAGRRARRRPPCSRTPSPAWPPGRPGTSASWSGSTGWITPTTCGRTAPTSSWTDLAELLGDSRDRGAGDLPDRAVVADRGRPGPRAARRARVGVRPVQRAHRHARLVRRGRAGGRPRHLPQRLLRGAPAALRRGRLRLPGAGPDRRQRHRRQAHPAAGAATRRWTSTTARSSSTAAPSTCAPACCAGDRVALAERPAGAGHQHPAGLAHPPVDRGDRVPGRATDDQGDLHVALQSDLLANEPIAVRSSDDPRAAAALAGRWSPELARRRGCQAVLVHHTRRSGLRMAAAWTTRSRCPTRTHREIQADDDLARLTLAARVPPGEPLRLIKYLAYGWSSRRSVPALRDQVEAALATAQASRLGPAARASSGSCSTSSGTRPTSSSTATTSCSRPCGSAVPRAAGRARAESQPIAGKGLTGPGYDGHAFWDTESFVLPVLTYTVPDAARDALRWRHSTLDQARDRRGMLGLRGAAFPWRTINGDEMSAYWPAGTAAFHVNADIADAVLRYVDATGDEEFERNYGAELLLETARLWALARATTTPSAGSASTASPARTSTPPWWTTTSTPTSWRSGTCGRRRMRCERQPDVAERLDVTDDELAEWLRAAAAHGGALRHAARRAHAVRRLHPPRGVGLRRHRRRSTTRCCCTTRTSTSTASRWSSRPTW